MSLRNRLTLGFFVITLAAIGVVFSYVIPTLESRLRDEKLDAVEQAARQYGRELRASFSPGDRKSTRLNSSHSRKSRMPSSA